MTDYAGKCIGSGLAWLGFWLFLGLACSNEKSIINVMLKDGYSAITGIPEKTSKLVKEVANKK
ncbi:MAG: hypothetical protein ACU84H_10010 [Gammaproteobacteria bacterium]